MQSLWTDWRDKLQHCSMCNSYKGFAPQYTPGGGDVGEGILWTCRDCGWQGPHTLPWCTSHEAVVGPDSGHGIVNGNEILCRCPDTPMAFRPASAGHVYGGIYCTRCNTMLWSAIYQPLAESQPSGEE